MKTASTLLTEIQNGIKTEEFSIQKHPARNLDDYMKEQYFMLLFSVLKESTEEENDVLSFIMQIAYEADFTYYPEYIVKYLYNVENFINDSIISFRDEEIKFLLGFEMYIITLKLHSETAISYLYQLTQEMGLPEQENLKYEQIYQVIKNQDLEYYTLKECYLHSSILRCYLLSIDFSNERDIAESNAYPDFPVSENYIIKIFGDELKRVSYFDFIIKSPMLNNMSTRFYGIQVRKCSDEEAEKYRYDLYALKSQKVEGNHFQDCDFDIGAVFIFYNHRNSFNAPVMVITHPLDMIEEVEAFIETEEG